MEVYSFASLAVAVFSGLIFYFGKLMSNNRVLPIKKENVYFEGFIFSLAFILMPASIIIGFLFPLEGLTSINSYVLVILIALTNVLLMVSLFHKKKRMENQVIDNGKKILPKTFLVSFWFVLSIFLIYYVSPEKRTLLTSLSSLASFGGFTFIALILSETEQNFRDVIIKTDKDEYQGILLDVSKDGFYRIQNHDGVYSINKDQIKCIIDTNSSYSKDVLFRAEGVHSAFNKVIRSDNLNENVERLKGDLMNWLENGPFEEFAREEIDVAIVYHYTDETYALDGDNLVKPIISTLENHDEDDPYLVEDDSQINQILVKTKKKDSMMQEKVKIDITERGQWREAHGRVTISFRKHSEKPMRLVHKGSI